MSLPVARPGLFFLWPVASPAQAEIVRLTMERREARRGAARSAFRSFSLEDTVQSGGYSRDLSRDRPEIAPSFDIFGHNRDRPSGHEISGHDFDSGAPHDERGRHFRSVSDGRSARRAKGGVAWRAR